MNVKQLMQLSKIIDKMDIRKDIVNIEVKDNMTVAKELFSLLITKIYKVEKEIVEFIADYKKINIQEAEEVNIIEFTKEILEEAGVVDFLSQA